MKKYLLLLIIPFLSFSQKNNYLILDCIKQVEDRAICECMVNSLYENLSEQEITKLLNLNQQESNRFVWEKMFKESFENPNFYSSDMLQFPCAEEIINFFANNTKLNSTVGRGKKDLGDYYINSGNLRAKGLKFKIKKPFKYVSDDPQVQTTIVKFIPQNWEIGNELVTFDVVLYDYAFLQMKDFKGVSKRDWKELCRTYGENYFELNGLFGWTQFTGGDDAGISDFKGSVLATFLFLDEYIIGIRSTNVNQIHTEIQKRVYYNMRNSFELLN